MMKTAGIVRVVVDSSLKSFLAFDYLLEGISLDSSDRRES